MRMLAIENVRPGMKLAKSIVTGKGEVLLTKGSVVVEQTINQLNNLGVFYLFVEDEQLGSNKLVDALSDNTRSKCLQYVCQVMDEAAQSKVSICDEVKEIIRNIIQEVISKPKYLLDLNDIRVMEDYTFSHSVNVAIISLILGKAKGYSYEELISLGTSAILHDIGKSRIPKEILDKPGSLTKEEFAKVKTHPNIGFEILKASSSTDEIVARVAKEHHEKYNGEGYPRGIKKGEVHEFSQIVAVADVYDALTSDRIYRKRFLPDKAFEMILAGSGSHFSPEIVSLFLKEISPYPTGVVVKLSNKCMGVVIGQNKNSPAKPIVRIIKTSNCPSIDLQVDEMNLSKQEEIKIMEIITN